MGRVIAVDRIACDGHGMCAELFPEWIQLDDWGYPIVEPRTIPAALERHARRAVNGCPKLALRLEREGTTDAVFRLPRQRE